MKAKDKCFKSNKERRVWIFQLIIFTAATIAAACVVFMWKNMPKIPSFVSWNDKAWSSSEYEPDFDESADEAISEIGAYAGAPDEIILKDRTLTVINNGKTAFTTEDLNVQDFLFGDIDYDGNGELMILCWRIGRYGTARPFWVKDDEKTWSQHIYIYDWTGSEMKAEWMASDIGMDVAGWSFDRVDRLLITETSGRITRWDWVSWGLSFIEECEAPTKVTMLFTGDNLIESTILSKSNIEYDDTFDFLYERYKSEIESADIAVLNQETIFINDSSKYSGSPVFGTPTSVGIAAIDAGFDIFACANNHALDMGMEGIDDTVNFYKENKKICIGIQGSGDKEYKPYEIVKKNGIRIALLDYTYGTNGFFMPKENENAVHLLENEELIRSDIRLAKDNSDICIVMVHWGSEYLKETDEEQEKWTDVFAQENVDAVIGSHPHVLQPFGYLKRADGGDMLIYYSLGNFVTHQTDEICKIGALAEFTVVKSDKEFHISDVKRRIIDAEV